MSEHLSKCGVPHPILERYRIAERWRSERWNRWSKACEIASPATSSSRPMVQCGAPTGHR
ncbi:MAG: hypothetical protein E6G89_06560 [Alphaproteobacteria bacterium]|nr:MAG: hypothetical protein E6G89_06560 [Alphaproteobacteria bacterium]